MSNSLQATPPTAALLQSRPAFRARGEEGGTLILVLIVITVLSLGFATYMQSLASYRVMDQQRSYDDKALMAAEAGLAEETGTMMGSSAPITSDTTVAYSLPVAQFAPFENVTVQVHPQTVAGSSYWTITSTAVADTSRLRGTPVSRRVQVTFCNDTFAKYELFVNNFGAVWTPGYVDFLGLGTIYMGPVNINSGCAFFPGFYALQGLTTAATGGIYSYANYTDYLAGVYGNNAANSRVSILDYWDSTYPTQPYFGSATALPTVMSNPITLPNATDSRIQNLTSNAGLTLPAGYSSYSASAGPNFVVTLSNGSGGASNGTIAIQQYLGTNSNGTPKLGPTMTTSVSAVNGTMIVQGNIVSLSGQLSGRLSIGATTVSGSMGNIHITGNLEYTSHANDSSFQYPNPNSVINSDGTVNTTYVNTVEGQLSSITDMLGLFAEGDVVIPQNDLSGNPIAASQSTPMTVDAIIMATGVSSDSSSANGYGGGFGVQNPLTRPAGQLNFLGGMVENNSPNMSLYNGNGITNGLALNEFWDKRAAQGGGGPPNFPSTGNYTTYANSWNSQYVQNAQTPITYPSIQ